MGDVAQDEHLLAGKGIAPDLPQGEAVQQGLGGMGMPAVTAVDDAAGDTLGQELGRAAAGMTDDDDVRPHGLQGQGRVLEALALVEARTGLGQGVGVGGKALAGHIERRLGAGAVLHEEEHHGLALEGRHLFDGSQVDFLETGGHVQQVTHVLCVELGDVQQVFVRPAVRSICSHGVVGLQD